MKSINLKYTQEMYDLLSQLKEVEGKTWQEIAVIFNRKYKFMEYRSANALRKTYTRYFQVSYDEEVKGTKKLNKKFKRIVFSSITPGAKTDNKLIKTLEKYCKVNKADLVLLENAKNFISDELDPTMADKILARDQYNKDITKHLYLPHIPTNVNVLDPVSGLQSIAAQKGSILIPATRHRMKMVPRMLKQDKTPRAIWSTGTVSESYYKKTKTGIRTELMHVKGAVVVDIKKDGSFFVRQLTFDGKGFYDLDRYYTSTTVKKERIEAISLGDDHALWQDLDVIKSTKEIIKKLKPKHVFMHDTLDCATISHHIEGKYITKAQVGMTLEEEAQITSDYIEDMLRTGADKYYLVASNHPEHLDRYLEEGRYVNDKVNHILGLELALDKARGHNPVERLLRKFNPLKKLTVLERKDSVLIAGNEMANHGDYSANGSRGNPLEIGLTHNGMVVTGHTHTPEIGVYGNFVNGTSTHLSLEYTNDSGSSSWLNAHTIVYKNGTKTHMVILPNGSHALRSK